MRAAGIDIGSRYIKYAVLDNGKPVALVTRETGYDPLSVCRALLEEMPADRTLATGYGRHLIEEDRKIRTITEIRAVARGARHFFPSCATIIDIGGQDTKVVGLAHNGTVANFEMNDRCAAGTGMFLEVIAKSLGYEMEEFGKEALKADGNIQINSMCTVFAQSEVTSLLARRQKRENIARGIHMAILNRTLSLLKRVSTTPDIVFAGGVAKNPCLKYLLSDALGFEVKVPEDPQMVGAYGAAIIAQDSHR